MSSSHPFNSRPAPQVFFSRTAAAAAQAQCDCACAAVLPFAPVSFQTDDECSSGVLLPLNDEYHVALSQQATVGLLNQSAAEMAAYFGSPHTLHDIPIAWTDTWGETTVNETLKKLVASSLLAPSTCPKESIAESPITLSVWLHITDRCNLRCSYCYLPHQQADMPLETGKAAVDAAFRSAAAHQHRTVKFKYAGGEPLLRFPLVAELHQYAQTQAAQRGLDLDGVVLSNGTLLTKEIIETLQSLHLRLMISLDGLGATHDAQRHCADGRSSSADAIRSIELALSSGLVPDISVTVTGRSAEGLPELTAWLLERDLPFSLNFYRENDFSAANKELELEEEKIISGMMAAFKVIEKNLPRRSLLASLVDRANLSAPHLRPCSAGSSYLVFDHAGQAYKCQMQMNRPVAAAQADDPLALIRSDKLGVQNISVDEKTDCQKCGWKYWCAGGCPLATHRASGRYDVKSPSCNLYKILCPAALRLEGLRLLKYMD